MAKLRNIKSRKVRKDDWYWPLGGLNYASEIHDFFPEEAEILGAITILWNRQELALKSLFKRLISSKRPDYAIAIWDRQPTHKARRDLIALSLHTAKLTKRQTGVLTWVLENTKSVADRRNELIHAEYVVHGRTDKLHAKVSAPNSTRPPKHQKADIKDLKKVLDDLQFLLRATEAAIFEFYTRKEKRLSDELSRLAEGIRRSRENPRNGSLPPSHLQIPGEGQPDPPQSSEA